MTTHHYQIVEPEASAWRAVEEHARGCGLVHGQLALDKLSVPGFNRGPADAGMLLGAMVEAGVLKPCKYDLAGASHSVRAFRTLGPSAGMHDKPGEWCRAHAHLWTYTPA